MGFRLWLLVMVAMPVWAQPQAEINVVSALGEPLVAEVPFSFPVDNTSSISASLVGQENSRSLMVIPFLEEKKFLLLSGEPIESLTEMVRVVHGEAIAEFVLLLEPSTEKHAGLVYLQNLIMKKELQLHDLIEANQKLLEFQQKAKQGWWYSVQSQFQTIERTTWLIGLLFLLISIWVGIRVMRWWKAATPMELEEGEEPELSVSNSTILRAQQKIPNGQKSVVAGTTWSEFEQSMQKIEKAMQPDQKK